LSRAKFPSHSSSTVSPKRSIHFQDLTQAILFGGWVG
jgi:hypothetical protein